MHELTGTCAANGGIGHQRFLQHVDYSFDVRESFSRQLRMDALAVKEGQKDPRDRGGDAFFGPCYSPGASLDATTVT